MIRNVSYVEKYNFKLIKGKGVYDQMSQLTEQLDALTKFRNRTKFSLAAWNSRGLNPSSDEMSDFLNDVFSACADELIDSINNGVSDKQLRKVLTYHLSLLRKSDHDTEEKEFICSLFDELSKIINVDFSNDLNKWLYGALMSALFKAQSVFNSSKIIETLSQPCTNCETELETHVLKREPQIPETDWLIVSCNRCGELNLISTGPGIKETKFGNYKWIENVRMEEHTYQQALARMDRLKKSNN